MAVRDWLDQSSDYNNVANWSGGAVPVDGDTIRFLSGTKTISTNLDQSTVDPALVIVGSQFAGVVGSPGSPLKYGTVTNLHYAARDCLSFNIWPAACTQCVIQATNPTPFSFYVADGAITNLIAQGGRGIHIGAGAAVTNLKQSLPAGVLATDLLVVVDAGATMTNVYVDGGYLLMNAAATYGRVDRGTWDHSGTSVDVTSLLQTGGTFILRGYDCDVPTLEVIAGTFDASPDGGPKSVGGTSLVLWSRAILNANNGARTITLGTATLIGSPTVILEPGRTLTVA